MICMEEKECQTSFREMCIREQTPVSLLGDKERNKKLFCSPRAEKETKFTLWLYAWERVTE